MMRHLHQIGKAAFVALLLLAPALRAADDNVEKKPVTLRVLVQPEAVLEIEGVKTEQTGPERLFVSPPVDVAKFYVYTLKITWNDNNRPASKTFRKSVRAGKETVLDLRPGTLTPKLDVVYWPTPQQVVDRMLALAEVKKEDTVFDLGCGDGRIVVTAAKKHGAKGIGIDIDPERIQDSEENARKANVQARVEFRQGNLFKHIDDLDRASVITLYLYPEVNLKLRPTLEKLKPGTRIVSHDFDMGDWKPLKKETLNVGGTSHTVYLWKVGVKEEKKAEKKVEPKVEKKVEPKKEKKLVLDVPYVPTPQAVVDRMLQMAKVKAGDVVYDLGCGDGRIVVTAAKKYKVKAFGFDIDPKRIKESHENIRKNNVGDLATVENKDIFKLDLSKATVITMYLLPEVNVRLLPQLAKLAPGSRIVTHDFDIAGYKPKDKITISATDDDGFEEDHEIYLWITPLQKIKDK